MVVKPNVVYLLVSLNDKYKGRIYIGYTVDPTRRLKQHNQGKEFGGAYKTNNRGPWEMILFVSGFPNEISALRFEWTLQHPKRSRRLRSTRKKKPKESSVDYHLYLLETMLNLGPWNRLPLTLHWLCDAKYFINLTLPSHIKILNGNNIPTINSDQSTYEEDCLFCVKTVSETDRIVCLSEECRMTSHLVCLARYMLGDKLHVLPIEKQCPLCDTNLIWGDIVKLKTNTFCS